MAGFPIKRTVINGLISGVFFTWSIVTLCLLTLEVHFHIQTREEIRPLGRLAEDLGEGIPALSRLHGLQAGGLVLIALYLGCAAVLFVKRRLGSFPAVALAVVGLGSLTSLFSQYVDQSGIESGIVPVLLLFLLGCTARWVEP